MLSAMSHSRSRDEETSSPRETNTLALGSKTTVSLVSATRVRIPRYDEYFNQRTFQTTLRKTTKPVPESKANRRQSPLVVRRQINARGQHKSTLVDIKNDKLRRILLDINRNVEGSGELTKPQPAVDPKLLLYSLSGLNNRLQEEQEKDDHDEALIEAIRAALQFISDDFGDTISQAEKLFECGEVTFDLLWMLFPPNTAVYHRHDYTEQDRVLLCKGLSYEFDYVASENYVVLNCEVICSDGSSFGIAKEEIIISTFDGSCKIIDLVAYPLKHHTNEDALRAKAISRGKKFAHVSRRCFDTSGPTMVQKEDRTDIDGFEKSHPKPRFEKHHCYGRVMIDATAFRTLQMNNELIVRVFRTLSPDNLTDDEYLIFNPVMLGFCFATKTWGGFAVERLVDVIWSEKPFEQLVLGDTHKRHIQSLVRQHSERAKGFDDIVAGKGQGLVGLLCGNPGCGKTLTAEAVSEATRRPLLTVNVGDLGTKPEEVDKALKELLHVAEVWGALLLLDEAEVFMQKRSLEDLTRNALVSVFLRHLEYYKGIMILTTNMPGQCDPAFQSRIHFCVKYPDLDRASRKLIWEMFLKKAMGSLYDIQDAELARLAEYTMNGRQIKNVVSSARSLALDESTDIGRKLSIEHIKMVIEVMNDWKVAIGPSPGPMDDGEESRWRKWCTVRGRSPVFDFLILANFLAVCLSVAWFFLNAS